MVSRARQARVAASTFPFRFRQDQQATSTIFFSLGCVLSGEEDGRRFCASHRQRQRARLVSVDRALTFSGLWLPAAELTPPELPLASTLSMVNGPERL